MRVSIILCLLFLVTACASKVTSITQDKDRTLSSDKGYLLLGLQSNINLKSILITGPENIELSSQDIKQGSNYLLLDLEAGTYTVKHIKLNKFWVRRLSDQEFWQFNVSAGKISYVGHLEVVTWGAWGQFTSAELVNRSSESLEYLENNFSTILQNRSIKYDGPGNDSFFEFLNKKQGGKS